ncbi:cupin domain-containing protein [Salinimicrobium xinjiangense]|uniref:cupin domain-containing protein n=1 Tax=Salinimicrobium xinjiangense TaxID=438596 RepID=UPI000421FFF9|nr:cupin domain-containing protein [Salinimicrobium xinjiangense]
MKTPARFNIIEKIFAFTLLPLVLLTSCNGNPDRETSDPAIQDRRLNEVPETLQTEAEPFTVNIEQATIDNDHYREVRWTGEFMQLVFMSLGPGEEIEMEVHDDIDQFIRIEEGQAQVRMGKDRDNFTFDQKVEDDWAVIIPAGYYHHVKNIGENPLKIYTLYAPGEHPEETIHTTYEEAREYEEAKGH